MILHAERRRHAALALDAVLEGDADQITLPVVGPGVVDAAEILDVTALLQRDQSAAVCAAILERVDFAVRVARHDDWRVADGGGAEVAGARRPPPPGTESAIAGPGTARAALRRRPAGLEEAVDTVIPVKGI